MYYKYTLDLTEHQQKKIINAYKNKTGVRIRVSNANLHSKGNLNVLLTNQQIKKIDKAKALGQGVEIKFSKTQLQKQGGFLSSLLNLGKLVLPFLAKKVIPTLGLAAASGAIQGATNKAVRGNNK